MEAVSGVHFGPETDPEEAVAGRFVVVVAVAGDEVGAETVAGDRSLDLARFFGKMLDPRRSRLVVAVVLGDVGPVVIAEAKFAVSELLVHPAGICDCCS